MDTCYLINNNLTLFLHQRIVQWHASQTCSYPTFFFSFYKCKNCKCFKRVQDSEEEDLTLSNQYQDYIDQMSDEEDLNISDQYQSDDYESDLEDSFESLEHDEENTEFVEIDDSFTE